MYCSVPAQDALPRAPVTEIIMLQRSLTGQALNPIEASGSITLLVLDNNLQYAIYQAQVSLS